MRDEPHVRVFDFIELAATLLSAMIWAFAATVFGFNMGANLSDITIEERNRCLFMACAYMVYFEPLTVQSASKV